MSAADTLVGEEIHFFGSITVMVDDFRSWVAAYGSVVSITAEMVESSRDRHGDSWLDLADDASRQERRWGQVMFARGPWPDGLPRLLPGSDDWAEARENARKAAHHLLTPDERRAALATVEMEYGPAPKTSRTILKLTGDARG
ncbi:hypothetical protein [Frondihabitans cladoniiphilus]|uniref:Uncharacterized protein n=1 Tax=Frondihabitans cladoniiphilus TaxID=715785 RepID=A0ABP8W435_9MICO